MIIDNITNKSNYINLHPNLTLGYEFIESFNEFENPDGKYELKGDDVIAIVSRLNNFEPNTKLEIHNQYIDLQFVVKGFDEIGWKQRNKCILPNGIFNTKDDYLMFSDKPEFTFKLNEKCFAIFYPNDAHSPLMKSNDLVKIVIKIKL